MPSGEVSLKCDRKQESISYPDVEPHFEGALQLGRICHTLPIHLIWGARNDFTYVSFRFLSESVLTFAPLLVPTLSGTR
jgi:hypothetical protein